MAVELERATVRSRAALAYAQAQERIDAGTADEPLAPLREVGERRLAREAARGGVSLSVPAQAIERAGSGYRLRYETPLPVERWNAQVSLLTGICAARIMIDGGVGLFRVLAAPEEAAVAGLRRSAAALGVPWPPDRSYPDVVRALDAANPRHAAFAVRASRLFRGAGYRAWTRAAGDPPPPHAAIAAPYAHVTAPLRRMADRVANEVVLALSERAARVGARGAPDCRTSCAGREPGSVPPSAWRWTTRASCCRPWSRGWTCGARAPASGCGCAWPRPIPRPAGWSFDPGLATRALTALPGLPEDVAAGAGVGGPREDEEQVGETVEVGERLRADLLRVGERHSRALGPPADRAGVVQGRRDGAPRRAARSWSGRAARR